VRSRCKGWPRTDVGSPIDFTYTLPFNYTGTIDKVTTVLADIDLGKAKVA